MERTRSETLLQTETHRYEYGTRKVRRLLVSSVTEWYKENGSWMLNLFGGWRVTVASAVCARATGIAVDRQHEANRNAALNAVHARQEAWAASLKDQNRQAVQA